MRRRGSLLLAFALGGCSSSEPAEDTPATASKAGPSSAKEGAPVATPEPESPPPKDTADPDAVEPEPEPAPLEIPPPPPCSAPADDEMVAKAAKYWAHADPSVSQFDQQLEKLPIDPTMRSAMARALMPTRDLLKEDAEGDIGWCRSVFEGVFDEEPAEMEPVEPTEIISASGCARRALLLHMMEHLTACDIEASQDSVRLILSKDLHEPEHTTALALVGQAERVGKAEWVLGQVFEVESPPSLQRLAVQRLAELKSDEAKDLLKTAAAGGRCDVAFAAAQAGTELGLSGLMPDIESAATPQEAFFELCMLASQEENPADVAPRWEPLVDEKGYQNTVDCRGWKDTDPEANGHCDPLSNRKRNPPEHAFGPTATCSERKGKVTCKSNPPNENSGVASRVNPTTFTFAKRSDRWVLDAVVAKPKVTDDREY